MRIEILGTGCAKCNLLESTAKRVVDELGLTCEFEHVRDIQTIIERGVMMTPALLIDGRVVCSGRVPREAEVRSWLSDAQTRKTP